MGLGTDHEEGMSASHTVIECVISELDVVEDVPFHVVFICCVKQSYVELRRQGHLIPAGDLAASPLPRRFY